MPDELTLQQFVQKRLRVEEGDDNQDIALLIDGAIEKLRLSGVPESDSALYRISVLIQVMLDYENRDKSLNVESLEKALLSNILQLRPYGGESNA